MTDPDMSRHEHEGMDECLQALDALHAFLHGELPESDADHVRPGEAPPARLRAMYGELRD